MKYKLTGISHKGNIRSVNQDNFYCTGHLRETDADIVEFEDLVESRDTWLAAVFDGMGGEEKGEIASLAASTETGVMIEERNTVLDPESFIRALNTKVCTESKRLKCKMGSTCVFFEFNNNKCRSWNVGDSRAYHFTNGKLSQLSCDHTEAAMLASVFGADEAVVHALNNRLTQFLGVDESEFILEPYVSEWQSLQQNDITLLCTDGLTHLVSSKDICVVLGEKQSLEEKKNELLNLALERGGLDNITLILIEAISVS